MGAPSRELASSKAPTISWNSASVASPPAEASADRRRTYAQAKSRTAGARWGSSRPSISASRASSSGGRSSEPLTARSSRLGPSGGAQPRLQRLELLVDLLGQPVAELGEVLADLGQLVAHLVGVDRHQLVQRFCRDLEPVEVERAFGGDEPDRGLHGLGLAVAAAEDPGQDT